MCSSENRASIGEKLAGLSLKFGLCINHFLRSFKNFSLSPNYTAFEFKSALQDMCVVKNGPFHKSVMTRIVGLVHKRDSATTFLPIF